MIMAKFKYTQNGNTKLIMNDEELEALGAVLCHTAGNDDLYNMLIALEEFQGSEFLDYVTDTYVFDGELEYSGSTKLDW